MSYETILEQIKDLPEECLDEISNYVSYVVYRYEKQKTEAESRMKETDLSKQNVLREKTKNIEELKKPELSPRFDVEDIRKLREYNSLRHINMTAAEIIAETEAATAEIIEKLRKKRQYFELRSFWFIHKNIKLVHESC